LSYTEIKRKQLIKTDLDTIWNFISSPSNLEKITPKWMKFEITSDTANKIVTGMIISYRVTPLLNIPLKWESEIIYVKQKVSFIDQQNKGPYKEWIHEHKLELTPEGVVMLDIIKYIPPFGIIGRIANWIFIKRRIQKIFDYRKQFLDEMFDSK
jgi:ligand-binding SRPBCC domain-containing protein